MWAIEDSEAKVVRRIFDMIEGGAGYRAISHALNADGIAAPRSAVWSHQTIIEMVRNERYAGRLIWNRTKNTKVHGDDQRRHEERPESEHVVRDAPERWRSSLATNSSACSVSSLSASGARCRQHARASSSRSRPVC